MGRVSLCLVIMFFICSAQKIDAQVQNIREKQDTISATKSLEHIRPENIKKGPLNNALDVLSGQSAGVNVTTNGTDRLAMLNSIRVRGTTSIMGGNDPLVIIDGVTSDIATLSTIYPADIESFTILKNATETAMYGSRGASGVIEIKTKKGTGRGFEISYDGNYGFESMYKHLQMLNGPEYIATAEAREELRRAKKEIQTEKLKGAATVAAANIAESVGSLFGSNKVKTLERENTALQNRIIELEEEARQRERQQAKQMQEMKSTYEQQNGKLSEFVNFVKCYFPYVEKLIPTINFLRDRLGFDDGIIRRLCTFKDVAIKGKLYSSEFNQSFETKRSICAIKENENGKFDFNIDGVPHVSWFRKKMSEF
jgi:TonB-dependent SusC/RagA subfamily outer membrane receptor